MNAPNRERRSENQRSYQITPRRKTEWPKPFTIAHVSVAAALLTIVGVDMSGVPALAQGSFSSTYHAPGSTPSNSGSFSSTYHDAGSMGGSVSTTPATTAPADAAPAASTTPVTPAPANATPGQEQQKAPKESLGARFKSFFHAVTDEAQTPAAAKAQAGPANPADLPDPQGLSPEYMAGWNCMHGTGVAVDQNAAFTHYMAGAKDGDPACECEVGVFYLGGRGMSTDYSQARYWFSLSADKNNPGAINDLGYLSETGNGVQQSYNEAAMYYRHAADLGNAEAMNNIGRCCMAGWGVPIDYVQARYWLEKSRTAGCPLAQHNLDVIQQSGH
jgi:TPR repeat protein